MKSSANESTSPSLFRRLTAWARYLVPRAGAVLLVVAGLSAWWWGRPAYDWARESIVEWRADWLYQSAKSHWKAGRYDAAAADYERIANLAPEHIFARMRKRECLLEAGEYEAALVEASKFIDEFETVPSAYLDRAEVLLKMGRYDEALQDCDRAWQRVKRADVAWEYYKDECHIQFLRADIYDAQGNIREALLTLGQCIENSLHADEQCYAKRAALLNRRGDYTNALSDFERALNLDENDRGFTYDAAGNVKVSFAFFLATCPEAEFRDGPRAVRLATKVCDVSKYADPNDLQTLAAACAEVGDFDAAVKWQSKANEYWGDRKIAGVQAKLNLYRSRKPFRFTAQ